MMRAFGVIGRVLLLASMCWVLPGQTYAQEKPPNTHTNPNPSGVGKAQRKALKKQQIRYLITHKPKKVLYGNPCVETYTRAMGFVYSPYYQENWLYDWWHNLKVKSWLTWHYGLGWKRKVRKRIKLCREASGDFRHY